MTNENAYVVDSGEAGGRLDRCVGRRSGLGLRAARRLIGLGLVRVDGQVRPAGYKTRPGQVVTLAMDETAGDPGPVAPILGEGAAAEGDVPRVVAATPGYAAFFKPSGLHTASLAGGGGASLEALLPGLCPGRRVILVNRLDRDTSGLVLGAFDEASVPRFRELEDQGLVDKRYLAVVLGRVAGEMVLSWSLDTADRARVKALDRRTPDTLRWTRVRPLAYPEGPDGQACPGEGGQKPGPPPEGEKHSLSLVEARIAKGARHQIRAHLAKAGFPIAGDALYGAGGGQGLKLHHWCVRFPGFAAEAPPVWHEFKVELERYMKDNPCATR